METPFRINVPAGLSDTNKTLSTKRDPRAPAPTGFYWNCTWNPLDKQTRVTSKSTPQLFHVTERGHPRGVVGEGQSSLLSYISATQELRLSAPLCCCCSSAAAARQSICPCAITSPSVTSCTNTTERTEELAMWITPLHCSLLIVPTATAAFHSSAWLDGFGESFRAFNSLPVAVSEQQHTIPGRRRCQPTNASNSTMV